jgi:hypothetical protein
MTAAVVPQTKNLGRASTPLDPSIRMAEYLRAIRHYIREPGFEDIVFCENTGADLTSIENLAPLASKHRKRLEVIGFRGDPSTIQRFGYYGCGDAEVMDHAFLHSRLLQHHASFYKVTGRYILESPACVVSAIGDRATYFCHDGFTPVTRLGSVLLEVMTAFFKVSKSLYADRLYARVMPTYEALYSHAAVNRLFPGPYTYVLLEQVYYLLLRDALRTQPPHRYVPVIFEHWNYRKLARHARMLVLSACRLDQFGTAHWMIDRLLFNRIYGEFFDALHKR